MPARTYSLLIAALVVAVGAPACGTDEPGPPPVRSAAVDVHLPVETLLVRDVVPPRTTLDALLREHGVASESVIQVIDAVAGVFDPRRLRSLQPFQLERTVFGALRRFEYEIDRDSFLRVRAADPKATALEAEVLPIPKTLEIASASIEITSDAPSLYAATTAAGERPELAVAAASLFSGEVDFNSEIQLGDRITVVFEKFHREGRPSSIGELVAAEFEFASDGRRLRLFRHSVDGATRGYYDEQGRSSKRFFLKSPLKFEPRITSGFNLRRRHPVLHTTRAHRGVDYGAPHGAPVVAVAAGTVVSATYDSANGRMVRLRHASGYQTYYLHLSRFEKGIRAGVRVAQGQVIGYVGSTGLSTGPHLHYGLTKNGVFVNPVEEHRRMPPGEPIPADSMPAFIKERDRLAALLDAARGSQPATELLAGFTPPGAASTNP